MRKRGGRKRALGTRAPMSIPQDANLRWSLDFVMDTLSSGRRFRILTLVDDFTRECLGLVVDTSLTALRVVRELGQIIESRGCPRMIVSDNGTEFTSSAILAWQEELGIEWHYIAPGKPMQNGFVESFMYRRPRGCKGFRQHFGSRSGAFMYTACNKSELSKMSSDSARRHSSLANQQASCAMKHQEALVLDALDWNETHIGAGDRFADRGRVSGVVLGSSPHVRFYVGGRNQSHVVPKPSNLACPIVSGGAGLDADQARCERGEERHDLTSPKALAAGHLVQAINSMNVEHVLRNVQPDCRDFHWMLLLAVRSIASISLAPRERGRLPHQTAACATSA